MLLQLNNGNLVLKSKSVFVIDLLVFNMAGLIVAFGGHFNARNENIILYTNYI